VSTPIASSCSREYAMCGSYVPTLVGLVFA
jgi:hypothetical protein